MSFYLRLRPLSTDDSNNDNIVIILSPGKQRAFCKVSLSIIRTSFEPFTRVGTDEKRYVQIKTT